MGILATRSHSRSPCHMYSFHSHSHSHFGTFVFPFPCDSHGNSMGMEIPFSCISLLYIWNIAFSQKRTDFTKRYECKAASQGWAQLNVTDLNWSATSRPSSTTYSLVTRETRTISAQSVLNTCIPMKLFTLELTLQIEVWFSFVHVRWTSLYSCFSGTKLMPFELIVQSILEPQSNWAKLFSLFSLENLGWGLAAGYQPRPQVVDRGMTTRYGGQLRYKRVSSPDK